MTQQVRNAEMAQLLVHDLIPNAPINASSWVPAYTQGVALTTSVSIAWVLPLGPLVFVSIATTFSNAGTAGATITCTNVPSWLTPVGTFKHHGSFFYTRAGIINYEGLITIGGGTFLGIVSAAGAGLGNVPNFAVANGDTWHSSLLYFRDS